MNLICLCLLLPIVCVLALPPTQYPKETDSHDIPDEFWSHHFGPDFQHAIHLHLEQTDLIDTGNAIKKHPTEKDEPEPKEGNKKRSTYIVHKPQANGKQNHTMENSMRVHLLQPDEIEALEKEMVNYAKNNKMAESPVVVNLPASEGATTKNEDDEKPVVLNVPPVVYHRNPTVNPHYMENTKSTWAYNNRYPSYANNRQHSYEYEKMQPSYEYKRPNPYQNMRLPTYEGTRHFSYDDRNFPSYEVQKPSYEGKRPSHEESRQPSYEESIQPSFEPKIQPTYEDKRQPPYEDERDTKASDSKDETVSRT